MQVVKDQPWIRSRWMNNNAESINHQMKLKQEWKKLPVSLVLDNIHDLVKLQMFDLRRALFSEGVYVLNDDFILHRVHQKIWHTFAEEYQDELFREFIRDSGRKRRRTTEQEGGLIRSADGLMTVLPTQSVACKPGQRRRSRSARTQ